MADQEGFFWENQSWAFSNSDNCGGSEEKSTKKVPESSMPPKSLQEAVRPEKGVAPAITKRTTTEGSKKGKGKVDQGGNEAQEGDGVESDHETHIWTERERRKKMRNMFSSLHALLPQLPPKADKSTIVDEAVSYIRSLQQTLQKLQKQKLESLHGAMITTSVNCDTTMMMISPQKLAMDTAISREAFLADQASSSNSTTATAAAISGGGFPTNFQSWTSPNVTLNICGDDAHISVCSPKKPGLLSAICLVMDKYKLEVVTAQVSSDHYRSMYMFQAHATVASNQFPEAFPVEEIYKQAAGEIMFWVSS